MCAEKTITIYYLYLHQINQSLPGEIIPSNVSMNSSAIEFQYNNQNDENTMSSSYRQRSTQQQLSHQKEKIPRIRTASTLEAMKVKLNK